MSFRGAAAYLIVTTLRNRVRAQWRRLRQPKYLVFTIVGLLYFWRVLFRDALVGAAAPHVPAVSGAAQAVLGAMALIAMLGAWLFGGDKAALRFSEAEVAFFFTAPVARRALIHFRLIRSLLIALASALVMTLFRARLVAHVPFFFVGAWLGLGTVSLHLTGAALTRASLAEHGIAGWRRRLLTLAVIAAVLGSIAWWGARSVPALPPLLTFDAIRHWAVELVRAAPLRWLLFPIVAPLRVAFARDSHAFVRALPAAVIVVGAHYLWAAASTVAFEEAADEASQRRARRVEARRGGRLMIRRGRPLFTLAPVGARWVAVTWKNLLAGTRVLPLRLLLLLGVAVIAGAAPIAALAGSGTGRAFVVAASLCATLAALLALLGPQTMRSDLRMDLPNMDLLRSYPLRGREVVTAAIAAPALSLVAAELFFLLLTVSLSLGAHQLPFSVGLRLAGAVVAASLLAAVTTAGLLLRNALVLFLPGWTPAGGQGSRGPEAIGQRALVLAGTLVLIVVGLLPAAIVGSLAAWSLFAGLGPVALVVGALVGATLFAVEAYFALAALGRRFDNFDLSAT